MKRVVLIGLIALALLLSGCIEGTKPTALQCPDGTTVYGSMENCPPPTTCLEDAKVCPD